MKHGFAYLGLLLMVFASPTAPAGLYKCIDAQGNVTQLFPNPVSDRNGFYPEGRVPGGRPVLLPDGLGTNRDGAVGCGVDRTAVEAR